MDAGIHVGEPVGIDPFLSGEPVPGIPEHPSHVVAGDAVGAGKVIHIRLLCPLQSTDRVLRRLR